jgi:hypothetical protein
LIQGVGHVDTLSATSSLDLRDHGGGAIITVVNAEEIQQYALV